ncbi:MAG TPA: hypothetical protein DF296_01495 [Candidatus Margulisbacteria bacterium]|nr:MAG: hypothetical protein A2X43_08405 [Candidatus Margulisbacteria bacterium GWD2_39_127]HCT83853.1 hypothetical protein [Candidatus Margulisiibacteriota bacterium]
MKILLALTRRRLLNSSCVDKNVLIFGHGTFGNAIRVLRKMIEPGKWRGNNQDMPNAQPIKTV